ncbi:hypothetical protein Q3G72_030878 [Acer saccharum]|nr:hypothetical protein Q3G72_030878 [Acer saccharum]
MEELNEVSIDPDHPDHKVYIGSRLPSNIRKQLIEFLQERRSSFAWSHADMVGIDPEVIVHRLQVDPDHQPIKQKRRKFAPERNKVINHEIQKLFDIGSVREVKYPDWLANVVVVKKKNGKWRICIDFTDLNKACPKDSFPLPHIDMLVDVTASHGLLSFMDAYSDYNQILMHPDNQEKTAFVIERGKFLGYLVTQRGVEANPDQIRSIENIEAPRCIKDVQKLTSRVAALNRFISKSSKRYSRLEKLALALVVAAHKLRPYFQCHSIKLLTTYPLKNILHKPELSGRLTKWAMELSEYDISFHPRSAMKSQVLADFITDFTPCENVQAEQELIALIEKSSVGKWKLSVDGSSNIKGSELGLVLKSPQRDILEQSIHCGFHATNNEAEYEALIAGLDLAKSLDVKNIQVLSDSQLVVRQMNGTYEAKDQRMSAYLIKAKQLQSTFDEFSVEQIPRSENARVDALASLESMTTNGSKSIPIIHLMSPTIQEA